MNESDGRRWVDSEYAADLIETALALVAEADRLTKQAQWIDMGLLAALRESRELVAASRVARVARRQQRPSARTPPANPA